MTEPIAPSARRGPLTPRQHQVLNAIILGEQYETIAKRTGFSRQVITNDVSYSARKMGVPSNRAAVAQYATYLAYNRAAALLRSSKHHPPMDASEVDVNAVLEGIAKILTDRATALLPS